MRPPSIVPDLLAMRRWLLVAILLSSMFQCVAQAPASADPALKALFDRGNQVFFQGTARERKAYLDSLAAHPPGDPQQAILAKVFIGRGIRSRGMARQALAMVDSLPVLQDGSPALLHYAITHERARGLKQLKMLPEAMKEAQRSFDAAASADLQEGVINALILMAELNRAQGVYDRALEQLIEAEKRATAIGYSLGSCNVMINRGNLYNFQERYEEAVSAYRSAYECAERNGFREIMENALFNEAGLITYVFPDSIEAGIHIFQEALAKAMANGDVEFEADLRVELGRVFNGMERYPEAIRQLRQALAIYTGSGDTLSCADDLLYLSTSYSGMGQLDSALHYARKALELCDKSGMVERAVEARLRIAELLSDLGRHEEATKHYKGYIDQWKALAEVRNGETIKVMEYRFETAKKENTIMLQDEQIAGDRLKKRGMLAIAILLLLVSGLVVRNNQHMRRVNAQQRELHEREVNELLKQQEINALDAMMQGQEVERDRIARDLHDRLGSMLSAVKLQFSAMEGRIGTMQGDQEQQYRRVFAMLDEAVSEVRRISHDLAMTSLSRFGLKGALEDLRLTIHVPGKLEVEMDLFGLEERFEQRVEVAVYRIVQECISNVLKHAQASTLAIQLTRSPSLINIIVEDNGRGFESAHVKEGMGMGNLRQRTADLGGQLNIDSRPGRGTTINIDIPLIDQGT